MSAEAATWLALALMALVTLATRLLGAEIMQRVGTTRRITRFLEAMSSSVMAAIVASFLARGGLREAAAVVVAVVVMLALRSAIWAMTAGVALAAAWTAVAG